MNVGDVLCESWSGNINKNGEVFGAVFSDGEGNGAIEKSFTGIKEFCRTYTATPSVYEQTDEMLDKTVSFFSFLERFFNESDDSLKNRFKAIFYRNGNTTWGTPYDVKTVFKEYFHASDIYLLENTNDIEDSLLQMISDIDFENGSKWVLKNCELTAAASFSKSKGVEFTSSESDENVAQTITVNNNHVYFLHWFMKGNLRVRVKNNTTGLFWDNSSKEWSESENFAFFESSDWSNKNFFFSLKNISSGDSEIEISFWNVKNEECYLDYVLCFKKQLYPSFTLIVHYTGEMAKNAMALAEGEKDNPEENIPENIEIKKENWEYYNQGFLTGPQSGYADDVYDELLEYVRSVGVKAYIEFLTKDYSEEESETSD